MATPSRTELTRLRDPGVFAERLIGEPLWPHQLQVAASDARFRAINAGRQVGKSRTLAVVALHAAFVHRGHRVLIISAGEDAARRLLAEIVALAASPWLGGSIADDDAHKLVLSNGSVIRCVPASQRQVRGWAVDLLIVDEACFVDEEIWSAARYTILARPGSRVLLASTPYGRRDKFFAQIWRMGMDGRPGYASWHWPSTISPLVDQALVEEWRATDAPRVFAREVLAEWVDEAGQYFTALELEQATGDHDLMPPQVWANRAAVVGGVDWGFASDANALVVIAGGRPDGDQHQDDTPDDGVIRYWVPWVEARYQTAYATWVDRLVEVAGTGYPFQRLACETNGVGSMPSQVLAKRLFEAGIDRFGSIVDARHTTAALKEDAFGFLKLLMQQGRIVLPRHPELLRQLSGLEFETTESGSVRIAVPERVGHDDLAMALALASLPLVSNELVPVQTFTRDDFDEDDDLSDFRIGLY